MINVGLEILAALKNDIEMAAFDWLEMLRDSGHGSCTL